MSKEYKHIPTGDIYKKIDNLGICQSVRVNTNIIPSYIVETGQDWQEVSQHFSVHVSYDSDKDHSHLYHVRLNKYVAPRDLEKQIYNLLNKEETNPGELYSPEQMKDFGSYCYHNDNPISYCFKTWKQSKIKE